MAGIRFVWATQLILATITLDLFAVLLGGVTYLVPVFAMKILHVGPIGIRRASWRPTRSGRFAWPWLLAHRPPLRRAGVTLLWAVAGFGAATIVFGVSQWFWLSLLMMFLIGALDNISVVVRHTLVQMLTPDEMRGRVSAVNGVFIMASNDLGGLESGLTAWLFGPVVSVVGGGSGHDPGRVGRACESGRKSSKSARSPRFGPRPRRSRIGTCRPRLSRGRAVISRLPSRLRTPGRQMPVPSVKRAGRPPQIRQNSLLTAERRNLYPPPPMLAHFARTAVVATLLAAAFSQARATIAAAAPPVQGMVVLRNGEVIEGKISRDEGLYIVDLPNGRIRIKQADVDLVCSNLEEGYRRKRATIQVGNVHDHLDLAQWCMRHNLLGLATVELADATAADPKNPMIGALQHRLKMAMEPPPPADAKKRPRVRPFERRTRPDDSRNAARSRRNVHPVGSARAAEPLCDRGLPRSAVGVGLAAVATFRRAGRRAGEPRNGISIPCCNSSTARIHRRASC